MRQKISIGFSPCPNDTFIFDAMIHGKIDSPYQFQPVIADVEELNELALQGALDVTKLSYSAYFNVVDQYYMLRSGSALGEGVGPLLISGTEQIEKPEEEWNVALPGKLTTAHLLFSLAYPKVSKKDFMLFNEIENAVLNGRYDAAIKTQNKAIKESKQSFIALKDRKIIEEFSYEKADTLYHVGDYQQALELIDAVLVARPRFAEILLLKLKVLKAQGNYQQASQVIAQLDDYWQDADPDYSEYKKFITEKQGLQQLTAVSTSQ